MFKSLGYIVLGLAAGFLSGTMYHSEKAPNTIFLKDLNNDGYKDAIIMYADKVDLFMGKPDGGYKAVVRTTPGKLERMFKEKLGELIEVVK